MGTLKSKNTLKTVAFGPMLFNHDELSKIGPSADEVDEHSGNPSDITKTIIDEFKKDFPLHDAQGAANPVNVLFWLIIFISAVYAVFKFITSLIQYFSAHDLREKDARRKIATRYAILLLVIAMMGTIVWLLTRMFNMTWGGA